MQTRKIVICRVLKKVDIKKCKPMDGQCKQRMDLPRMIRDQIIQDYLSGRKTRSMLSKEHGISLLSVSKIVSYYRKKNSVTFDDKISQPIMPRTKNKTTDHSALQAENERLKRQLQMAHLKIEGYQTVAEPCRSIMGDILEEEYGIDLLKKVEAGQCRVLKKDTQKSACSTSANCSATVGKPITKA
jgi:transposase-like protein